MRILHSLSQKKKYKNSKSTCENNIKNDKNVYQIHHYARVFIQKKIITKIAGGKTNIKSPKNPPYSNNVNLNTYLKKTYTFTL